MRVRWPCVVKVSYTQERMEAQIRPDYTKHPAQRQPRQPVSASPIHLHRQVRLGYARSLEEETERKTDEGHERCCSTNVHRASAIGGRGARGGSAGSSSTSSTSADGTASYGAR